MILGSEFLSACFRCQSWKGRPRRKMMTQNPSDVSQVRPWWKELVLHATLGVIQQRNLSKPPDPWGSLGCLRVGRSRPRAPVRVRPAFRAMPVWHGAWLGSPGLIYENLEKMKKFEPKYRLKRVRILRRLLCSSLFRMHKDLFNFRKTKKSVRSR